MDMHVHSEYSDAPKTTLDVITEICLARRLGVAVTDHNEIRGSIQLLERQKVLVLPGIEVGSTERLEFLIYFRDPEQLEDFYRTNVEPFKRQRFYAKLNRSFTMLIPAAKELGALICLPHPFAPSYKNLNFSKKRKAALLDPEIFSMVDMIEVLNGQLADHRNFKAFMLSEVFDKNACAGSDAHRPQDIANIFMRFDRELDRRGVFDLLHFPIKMGITHRFSFAGLAKTGRGVIPKHLQLFFFKKRQRQWMMKYDDDPAMNGRNGVRT